MTPAQMKAFQGELLMKFVWTMDTWNVPWDRIVNIDETSCLLTPLPTKSWKKVGEPMVPAEPFSSRQQCTLSVGISTNGAMDMQAQLVFKGTTSRSEPQVEVPENMSITHSETHWATQESFLGFVQQCENALFRNTGPDSWILIIDLAPIHCAREALEKLKEQHPLCNVLFCPPKSTSVTQPLDRSYFKGLKASLRKSWAATLARLLRAEVDDCNRLRSLTFLKCNIPAMVSECLRNIDTGARRAAAWRHLRQADADEFQELVAQAIELHNAGLLFSNRATAEPEEDLEQ